MGVDTNDLYPEGEATKAPPSSHISFKLSLADELRCVICPARECPHRVESGYLDQGFREDGCHPTIFVPASP